LKPLLINIITPLCRSLETSSMSSSLRKGLDRGVALPPALPLRTVSLPPTLPQTGMRTSSPRGSTSRLQRSRPSDPYVALKFDIRRSLKKRMDRHPRYFDQVMREVMREYENGRSHNVLGCDDCYAVAGYCRQSSYHPQHPFHRCPLNGEECPCE